MKHVMQKYNMPDICGLDFSQQAVQVKRSSRFLVSPNYLRFSGNANGGDATGTYSCGVFGAPEGSFTVSGTQISWDEVKPKPLRVRQYPAAHLEQSRSTTRLLSDAPTVRVSSLRRADTSARDLDLKRRAVANDGVRTLQSLV